MNTEHPTPPPSIEPNALNALAAEFNAWRAQRASRRAPIPETLRQTAVALLTHFRRTHIITALGINNGMLKAWENRAPISQPQFIPLSLPCTEKSPGEQPIELTISNNRGQRVTLQGGFSPQQMALVVRALSAVDKELVL